MSADRDKACPTTQRFAVFRHPENPPESWRSWSAYTRDFNTAWRGFVGFYEGHGATRRERKADAIKRARADNRDPMDGIDPTPPAPADAKCNAPGCSVCAAGLPHTTHSYPMTAPAPADDARERGLAAYDALNMREKSEIAAQHPRYCYAKGYVAALAGRAADASGAEAMREACAKACRDRSRSLYDGKQMAAGLEAAKCADMIDALPLPARDDAVEEAERAVLDAVAQWRLAAIRNAANLLTGRVTHEEYRFVDGAVERLLNNVRVAHDALAALRRAKGSPR